MADEFDLQAFRDQFTIAGHARNRSDQPAVISDDRQLTYSQLFERTNRFASVLTDQLGLVPGDRICTMLRNPVQAFEIANGATLAGCSAIPVNNRFNAEELGYIVNDSGARVLVIEAEFADVVANMPATPELQATLVIGDDGGNYEQHLAQADATPRAPASATVTSLRYTSDTTGQPKAARRDLDLINQGRYMLRFMEEFDYRPGDVHLTACPLHHTAPPVFAGLALSAGGTVILMQKFDAIGWLERVERHGVNSAFVVPTILQAIVDLPDSELARRDLGSLRSVVVAAARCPAPLKHAICERLGDVFYEFYGSTEGSVNTIMTPDQFRQRPDSCGRAFPLNEIRVVDEDGNDCPVGTAGELWVKNPFILARYEGDQAKTSQSIREGYYCSGDIGYVDADGYYFIVDRIKDMIISGGVNIYPAEIEAALRQHPGVKDAAAVGIPDDYWGEKVVAFVVPTGDGAVNDEQLQAHCAQYLADYKRPRQYILRDDLPYTPEGKLRKRDLRDLLD